MPAFSLLDLAFLHLRDPFSKFNKTVYLKKLSISDLIQCLPVAYFFSDIDECFVKTDDCEQNCHNTEGGYNCSCGDGYTLGSDGLACDGNFMSIYKLYVVF